MTCTHWRFPDPLPVLSLLGKAETFSKTKKLLAHCMQDLVCCGDYSTRVMAGRIYFSLFKHRLGASSQRLAQPWPCICTKANPFPLAVCVRSTIKEGSRQGRFVEASLEWYLLLSVAFIRPGDLIVGVSGFQLLCGHGVLGSAKALKDFITIVSQTSSAFQQKMSTILNPRTSMYLW